VITSTDNTSVEHLLLTSDYSQGLHLGSGSAMKLCSTRLGYLWLEAACSGPQQTEGEPPDQEGVNSSRHD
jgi:hypothetical protein